MQLTNIPVKSDPRWAKLISENEHPELQSLALKMHLTSLRMIYARNPTRTTLAVCIDNAYSLLQKIGIHPNVRRDLSTIFGDGGLQ